jgi:hypothetical protein
LLFGEYAAAFRRGDIYWQQPSMLLVIAPLPAISTNTNNGSKINQKTLPTSHKYIQKQCI